MEKVPAEVLEVIFANLLSYKDSANASKVCTTWRDVLHSTRRLWLFSEVFPLILDFLTEREIFVCRLVCKHWCLGVEHVLENSPHNRPPAGYINQRPEHHLSVIDFWNIPNRLGTGCHHSGSSRGTKGMEKMLLDASEHTHNPLLGRSASVFAFELSFPAPKVQTIYLPFLRTFGSHIWFLEIVIHLPSFDLDHFVDTFKQVLDMLSLVPNLKKLVVSYATCLRNAFDWFSKDEEVLEYLTKDLSSQERDKLPKLLETLIILDHTKMFHALIPLLANSNLRALDLSHSLTTLQTLPSVPNLVDINVQDGYAQLPKELWPLQRLQIFIDNYTSFSHAEVFFRFVNFFQATLCHLKLKIDILSDTLRSSKMDRIFENREALVGCQNLKKVTLEVYKPFRLDFLCGLANRLEYLHISITNYALIKLNEDYFGCIDLFKYIKIIGKQEDVNSFITYESNVWNIFPKLRLVTVKYSEFRSRGMYEYRRQVYDKLGLAKKSHLISLVWGLFKRLLDAFAL